jgi:hypothetical protein
MGGLIIIIPILAFNIWLFCTTGRRQTRRWLELKQWRQIAAACAIGVALAVWLTFFVQYGHGLETRKGFPIPLLFFHAEDKTWTHTDLPTALLYASGAVDFLTGLTAPFIPYKIAEFLKQVKAELK